MTICNFGGNSLTDLIGVKIEICSTRRASFFIGVGVTSNSSDGVGDANDLGIVEIVTGVTFLTLVFRGVKGRTKFDDFGPGIAGVAFIADKEVGITRDAVEH